MQSAFADLTESMIDTWSESQLKEFCDKNGITGTSYPSLPPPFPFMMLSGFSADTSKNTVPQGTKLNELRALVRKHRERVLGTAEQKFGAATTSAGNQFAKATDSAALMYEEAFQKATDTWSQSRLKSFLDARGVVCVDPILSQ